MYINNVYDDTLPNPTVISVGDVLKVYHINNCNGIIAIGAFCTEHLTDSQMRLLCRMFLSPMAKVHVL